MEKCPILCIGFDGVLHSCSSGWHGQRKILDPPVPGAIVWLRSLLTDAECVCAMAPRFHDFDVQIHSSRSKCWGGRRAMKKWLGLEFEKAGFYWQLVELIKFPSTKPPAFLQLDARGMCFTGTFPTPEAMKAFKSWNEK